MGVKKQKYVPDDVALFVVAIFVNSSKTQIDILFGCPRRLEKTWIRPRSCYKKMSGGAAPAYKKMFGKRHLRIRKCLAAARNTNPGRVSGDTF